MDRRTFLKYLGASGLVAAANPKALLTEEEPGVEIVEVKEKPKPKEEFNPDLAVHGGGFNFGPGNVQVETELWVSSDYNCLKCDDKLSSKIKPGSKTKDVKCNCGFKGIVKNG